MSRYDHLVPQNSDHANPTVRDFNPYHTILHRGINDLIPERAASQIARSIIELELLLKSWDNNKPGEVNSYLIHMCAEQIIPYIDHTNSLQPENHLNESNLMVS